MFSISASTSLKRKRTAPPRRTFGRLIVPFASQRFRLVTLMVKSRLTSLMSTRRFSGSLALKHSSVTGFLLPPELD